MALAGAAPVLADEPDVNLMALQVFAKGNIKAASSDYQGATAAGGDIDLTDFSIGGNLTSGRHVTFLRGSVDGMVSAPDRSLSQVNSEGSRSALPFALEMTSKRLDRLSASLSALPATAEAIIRRSTVFDKSVETIAIRATRDMDVVDLQADQLSSAGWDQLKVELQGDLTARLLVRVRGSDVRIRHVGFSTTGGLDPSNVVFFFPDATSLEISEAGGAFSASGRSLGIPGSVVAPNASLRFGSALISGQVFVKDILPIPGEPGGQIDRLTGSAPGSAFLAYQMSGVLRADKFLGCARVD